MKCFWWSISFVLKKLEGEVGTWEGALESWSEEGLEAKAVNWTTFDLLVLGEIWECGDKTWWVVSTHKNQKTKNIVVHKDSSQEIIRELDTHIRQGSSEDCSKSGVGKIDKSLASPSIYTSA